MATLDVTLVAVDRPVWNGQATGIITRTMVGDIGILPGHEPFLATLADGVLRIDMAEGDRLVIAVHGGFISVDDNVVKILAETAELGSEVDVERAERAKERATRRQPRRGRTDRRDSPRGDPRRRGHAAPEPHGEEGLSLTSPRDERNRSPRGDRFRLSLHRNWACRNRGCGGLPYRPVWSERDAGAGSHPRVSSGSSCVGSLSPLRRVRRPLLRGRNRPVCGAGLHPVRGFAPGAGAAAAGVRGRSAPGSGVCTRRGGGSGRIWADSPRPGCKPPIPGAQLPARRRSQPPSRVQTTASGAQWPRGGALKPPPRVRTAIPGAQSHSRCIGGG